MKLLIRIGITSILVLLIAHVMKGVQVAGFFTPLLVAVVLGLLNVFIKPIFIALTLPFTIITLGLFLLIINAALILLCSGIVGGFEVDTFGTAFMFSVVLSLSQSILFAIVGKD